MVVRPIVAISMATRIISKISQNTTWFIQIPPFRLSYIILYNKKIFNHLFQADGRNAAVPLLFTPCLCPAWAVAAALYTKHPLPEYMIADNNAFPAACPSEMGGGSHICGACQSLIGRLEAAGFNISALDEPGSVSYTHLTLPTIA